MITKSYRYILVATLAMGLAGSAAVADGQTSGAPERDVTPFIGNLFSAEGAKSFVDGSGVTIRFRNENDALNNQLFNQAQGKVDILMGVAIDPSGKLQVHARVLSGSDFQSSYNNLGLGNNTDLSKTMGLRQLYLDFRPTQNLALQGGSMAPVPQGLANAQGVMSLDTAGWIDGARASYANLASWADRIVVTVGRLGELDKVNVYDRANPLTTTPNFMQIHVQGRINPAMTYLAEGTGYDHEKYIRGVLAVALPQMVRFADSVVVEEVLKKGSSDQQGFAASLKKGMGKWNLTEQYSYKTAALSVIDPTVNHLPLQNEYGAGHQLSVRAERPTKYGTPYIHASKNFSQGADTLSRQGTRVEVGMKIGLGSKKSSTQY